MRFLNRGRRSGKTTMLIHAAYLTNTPIIALDNARAHFIKKQAEELGFDIEVYSIFEWKNHRDHVHRGDVLIDEAKEVIELALDNYLEAHVQACSFSIPMTEAPIKKKEAEDEASNQ